MKKRLVTHVVIRSDDDRCFMIPLRGGKPLQKGSFFDIPENDAIFRNMDYSQMYFVQKQSDNTFRGVCTFSLRKDDGDEKQVVRALSRIAFCELVEHFYRRIVDGNLTEGVKEITL